VFAGEERALHVPVVLWIRLLWTLRRRGEGRRESGAFLLGARTRGKDRVRAFLCYDDVDPTALDTGIVTLKGTAFGKVWAECRRRGMRVLADVHTHPDTIVRQSVSDRTHPMIGEPGHVAVILPRFAQTWGWRFRGVGLYEYEGDGRWRDLQQNGRSRRVRFSWR